jgi:hypothetical protein
MALCTAMMCDWVTRGKRWLAVTAREQLPSVVISVIGESKRSLDYGGSRLPSVDQDRPPKLF